MYMQLGQVRLLLSDIFHVKVELSVNDEVYLMDENDEF